MGVSAFHAAAATNILMQIAISRQTDAAHLNSIANHPEVYKWVAGNANGPLDFAPVMDNPDVFVLMGEHGGQVYHRLQPGLFEAHSQCRPEGRGEWMYEATRKTLHWIFTRTECMEIMTRVPHGNTRARSLAQAIGGRQDFVNPKGWIFDGKPVAAEIFSLKVQDWMRTAPGLVERGKWFHGRLNAEFDRHGVPDLAHDDDETHDRYVGAAVEMMFGGQPLKGAVLYNRWACMSGYHPISVVSLDPLAVDIGTALLVMRGDDFFIPSLKATTH